MTASLLPTWEGQNFAPLEPLLKLQRGERAPTHYLCDALRERFEHYIKQDAELRRLMLDQSQLLGMMAKGINHFCRDPYGGGWKPLRPQNETHETQRYKNHIQYYQDVFLGKWGASQPEIPLRALVRDDPSLLAAAAGGTAILKAQESEIFTAHDERQIGAAVFLFGTALTRIRHLPDAEGGSLYRELFETQELELMPGQSQCFDCGHRGRPEEFGVQADSALFIQPTCPACGSIKTETRPAQTISQQVPVGQEAIPMGAIRREHILFPQAWWDLRKRAEESDWFIQRQESTVGAMRGLLGSIDLPPMESDPGLDMLNLLSKNGLLHSQRSSSGRSEWAEPVTIDQLWLSPQELSTIPVRGDEQTVSGAMLPQGEGLEKVFPKGGVALGLNGMRVVLGLYGERNQDSLGSLIYHVQSASGVGRGAEDLIEVAKQSTKLTRQLLESWDAAGTPGILYAKDLIAEDYLDELGKPASTVPADIMKAGAGQIPLNQLVHQLPPATPAAGMMEYTFNVLNNDFRLVSGAVDFLNGPATGVKVDTLGGQRLLNSVSQTLIGPVLSGKAELRRNESDKVLRMSLRHFPPQYLMQMVGESGENDLEYLLRHQQEIGKTLRFEVKPNSELPRDVYSERTELTDMLTQMGGIEGYLALKATDPEALQKIETIYGFNLSDDNLDLIARRCYERIEQAAQLIQMGSTPEQAVVLLTPPITAGEEFHQQRARILALWMDTPRAWKPENLPLRQTVELMQQLHIDMDVQRQAYVQTKLAEIAATGAAASAAMNPMPTEEKSAPKGKAPARK